MPTLGAAPEVIVSPVFHEDGFDLGEEASLQIPETGQHSKECFVSSGVPHPRNLISYPFYRQSRPMSLWPHTGHMVKEVPRRLRRSAKACSKVAPTRAAISMRRS
jgi:hypothetical protein